MRIATVTQFADQIDSISDQMLTMQTLQLQSKGTKIQSSSDDPVLADQIKSINDYITSLGNYDISGKLAQNRSSLFSGSVQNCIGVMDKVRELTQAAESDTLNNNDRVNIANELQGYLTRLLAEANTQDGNGSYIYSGFSTNTPAYMQKNGSYQYQGGLDATMIDIGVNSTALYNESGYTVFGNIQNGNGSFTVMTPTTNTGTVTTSSGSILNTSSYIPDNYTISFVTNSSGQLAYQIVGAKSGQIVPQPPATTPADAPLYQPDTDITFNGINLHLNGGPNVGDTIKVAPSQNENLFDIMQGMINTLKTPISTPAQQAAFHQQMTQSSSSLYQASDQLRSYLSQVGTRGSDIDTQVKLNGTTITTQKVILGTLANSNMEAVISELAQQNIQIQTTTGVYLKIQETLFQLMKSMSL
jgi:flagellar hook-associated protein 3 FlgL